MAENSSIAWTDHTWNAWRGCTKVSPACANCYAEALSLRYGHGEYKRGVPRIRLSEENWKKPYRWNKKHLVCDKCGQSESAQNRSLDPICGNCGGTMHRARVFTLSLGDWLDDEVPIHWLADMLQVIYENQNLDWLLLTKRPQNFFSRLRDACSHSIHHRSRQESLWLPWLEAWTERGVPPGNVRIGITVEDQPRFDERIEHFVNIPAKSRFLSIEPMLSGINLSLEGTIRGKFKPLYMMVDQIIVGGESGSAHKERQLDLHAAADIYAQCKQWGVKFFMKQDSGPRPGMRGRIPDDLWVQEFPV
jgi:protein gp37